MWRALNWGRTLVTTHQFGRIEVRPAQREVLLGGSPIPLGARAYDLLMALVDNRDRVVPKDELLDRVWPGLVVEEGNLHTQVSTLRKALGSSAIATIPGRGYRFVAGDDRITPGAAPSTEGSSDSGSSAPFGNGEFRLPTGLSLIGREQSLSEMIELLTQCRLLTIVGPGGIGKTSVALALTSRLASTSPHEIRWVELEHVVSCDGVVSAVANALNVHLGSTDRLADLARTLEYRHCSVVLDNCEQVAGDVAAVLQALLNAAPHLRFLTTSRESLKVPGEHLYALDCLRLPSPDEPYSSARLAGAVQLFEQRSRQVDRKFALSESNLKGVVKLCVALDGNPLAIGMAAARLPSFGVEGILAHLEDRLRLLGNNVRTSGLHQATLRSTLDWSYALLSSGGQRALRLLSVFTGSFSIEAAKRLVAGDDVDEYDALDSIGELVDKSMLAVERQEPQRFRLLETTRVYAAELLASRGEMTEALVRHGAIVASMSEEAEAQFWFASDSPWLAQHGDDFADAQVTFDRACARDDPETAAAIVLALRCQIYLRNTNAAVARLVRELHRLVPKASLLAQARIWTFISSANYAAIDGLSRVDVSRRRVALWRALGKEPELFEALCRLAVDLGDPGEAEESERAHAEAAGLIQPDWPIRRHYFLALHEAWLAKRRGPTAYLKSLPQAMRLAEEAGSPSAAAYIHLCLAEGTFSEGNYSEARRLASITVTEALQMQMHTTVTYALTLLSSCDLLVGDVEEATRVAARAFDAGCQANLWMAAVPTIALLASRKELHTQAAQLLGAAEAWYRSVQGGADALQTHLMDLASVGISQAIGDEEHASQRARGSTLGAARVHALARSILQRDAT